MILLRANSEIRVVFLKMIKTMGEEIHWTEIIMITNNDVILVGKDKSLFFNFESKTVFNNYIDISIEENRVDQIIKGTLLENTLNMLLYAFGKWGGIKGLTVEMDYEQLNQLLNKILLEVRIKASLTKDYFRFYKEGVAYTYEDVIQEIISQSKGEEENQNLDTAENNSENTEKEETNYSIGLWHKIQWKSEKFVFEKEVLTDKDKKTLRIGRNFYMVGYKCPNCKEKLHMTVYPEGNEYRIETEKEGVYLARAYTCNICNYFYTPKPQRLLMEGAVYSLNFEEDKVAYTDYLELLGKTGERTFNGNFNQYESRYLQKEKEEKKKNTSLEELIATIRTISDQEMIELKEKLSAGFYPMTEVKKHYKIINKEIRRREKIIREKNTSPIKNPFLKNQVISRPIARKVPIKPQFPEIRVLKSEENRTKSFKIVYQGKGNATILKPASQNSVHGSQMLQRFAEQKYINQMKKNLQQQNKQNLQQQKKKYQENQEDMEPVALADTIKNKSYTEIARLIDQITLEKEKENKKQSALEVLQEELSKRGEQELKNILLNIPADISKQQYHLYKEKIKQYETIDTSSHRKVLKEKRSIAEKKEISTFIKRRNPVNRITLFQTYQELKKQDFQENNVQPYLENIYNKILTYDQNAIKKICPEPVDVTFQEGLKVYEEISKGDFLPELKANFLGILDQRLSKIKMDECEQLVEKLRKKIKWNQEDYPRIHLYDVRNIMRRNKEDGVAIVIQNALNTYASGRGRYEYPIMICDDSFRKNGKTGYILTPDHIYYNSLTSSGYIKIEDIEAVMTGRGTLRNKIYVKHHKAEKVKIFNKLNIHHLKSWLHTLNEFIAYLQEKPESREISYLAKEKHEIICCYRCGYTYQNRHICPRCGSKNQDWGRG